MRDLLPAEAKRLQLLTQRVLRAFEAHGYEPVSVPPFEYAEVLEHDVGEADASRLLRFVEPESGAVLALRPDMTPQIARLIASRLAGFPSPVRLCYEGFVVRRRRERARRDRQLQQAGIELVGAGGPAGDLEVIAVASDAMRAAGLDRYTLDLGHAMVSAALLGGARVEDRDAIVEALAMKDGDEVRRRAEQAGLSGRDLAALIELPMLYGGSDIWGRADALLRTTSAEEPARELRALSEAIERSALVPNLVVDLGETWTFSYYTGAMFRILAHGPGEPVGSGGRYDQLFHRFGMSHPAAGFAIDLGNLSWALERTGVRLALPPRLLVRGTSTESLLASLRQRGIACVASPAGDATAYGVAWRFTHHLEIRDREVTLTELAGEKAQALKLAEPNAIAAAVAAALSSATT